tara:strand:- start:10529 stop:10723 length:195 start_codon:yes stop_codon:yes gene_type:complete
MSITPTDISEDYTINTFSGSLGRNEYQAITGSFAPFRFSFHGAPNIRLQSTNNPYRTFIGEQQS